MQNLLWVGIGVIATLVIGLAVYFLARRSASSNGTIGVPDDAVTSKALQNATDALVQQAKAEAKSEGELKKIDDIMKVSDPKERLKQLADALKDV